MTLPPRARIALALGIGVGCGLLGYNLGMPLPWMLGPMIGVTIAAMLHLPIAAPDRLRPVVIPVIGVMLGSAITSDILTQMAAWTATLLILVPVLIGSAAASFLIYRRVGGYDPVTAFYCAMPGGLNEMLIMGEEAGGNAQRIALAHAARVLMVIFFVALVFGLFFGVTSGGQGGAGWVPLTALTGWDYAGLTLCAVVGVPLARLLRLPAAPVFGPMILSGVVHILGWVTVSPPSVIVIAAQIVMGTVIGSRFIGARLVDVRRDLLLAAVATPLMLGAAFGFAALVAYLTGMPLSQVFLGYAPGGLTEMALLTLAMDQDVAFVSVTHIIRITLVIAVAPLAFGIARRYIST